MKITAIILAAGQSSRFGEDDKLFAPLAGKPLARHVADTLSTIDIHKKIAVISNNQQQLLFPNFDYVHIGQKQSPMSDSLKAGLNYAMKSAPDKILILLADMPFVDKYLLEAVIKKCHAGAASACTDGHIISPPACFSQELAPLILNSSGNYGARNMIQNLEENLLVNTPSDTLKDIDTRPDLQNYQFFYN